MYKMKHLFPVPNDGETGQSSDRGIKRAYHAPGLRIINKTGPNDHSADFFRFLLGQKFGAAI
jgi:hypothetical protein